MKWHTVSTMFIARSSTTTIVLSAESSGLAVAAYFENIRVFESTNIPTGYCFADPPRPNTLDGCPPVSTTEPINIFAVDMRVKERPPSLLPGRGLGESMQAKLEKLENFGDIRVQVNRLSANNDKVVIYRITFKNAPYNLPQLRVAENNVLTVPTASQQVEIQEITATTGSFSISIYGRTTARLLAGDTDFETQLKQILPYEVSVLYNSGSGTWTIKFPRLAGNVPELIATSLENSNSDVAVKTIADGALPSITIRTVRRSNRISGAFTINVAGQTSPPVPYDASSSAVRLAVLGLSTVGDDIRVIRSHMSKAGGYTWFVIFAAEHPDGHPLVVVDGNMLTGMGVGITSRRIQLGGSHGRVYLPRIDGLALTKMAHDSSLDGIGTYGATLSVKGSIDAVNNALSQLTYVPDYLWSGHVRVYVSVNDHGFSGFGGAKSTTSVLGIAVLPKKRHPRVVAPESFGNTSLSLKTKEDVPLQISEFRVYDADAGADGIIQVSLSATHGTFTTAVGQTVFNGTATDINKTLQTLVYVPKPHTNGVDFIHLRLEDEEKLTSFETYVVQVDAVNDSPEIIVETSIIDTMEHRLTHVDGVSIRDNDMHDYEYQNTLLNFSLIVNHGVLGLRSMEGLGGIIFLEIFIPTTILRKNHYTFWLVYGM